MTAVSIVRGRLARPRRGLRYSLWLLPAAFALHVLEEARGFTDWVGRNGRADYSMADFVQLNPAFHVGSTVASGEWSPGTASAVVLFLPLWWHLTRRALSDRILGVGGMSAGIAVGGAVHAAAVANQVFGLSLSPVD